MSPAVRGYDMSSDQFFFHRRIKTKISDNGSLNTGKDVGRYFLGEGINELMLYPIGESINFLPLDKGTFIYKSKLDEQGGIILPEDILKKVGMSYGDDVVFAIVGTVGNICKREEYEAMFEDGRLGRFLEEFEKEHDIF